MKAARETIRLLMEQEADMRDCDKVLATLDAAIKAAQQPEPGVWAVSNVPTEQPKPMSDKDESWTIQFCRALLSAQPDGWVNEWQPIDTAPREGKWVLLWWPYVVNRPMVGYCIGSKWYAAPSASEWGNNPPTLWMPLPAAPKEAR